MRRKQKKGKGQTSTNAKPGFRDYIIAIALLLSIILVCVVVYISLFRKPAPSKVVQGYVFNFVYLENQQELLKRDKVAKEWLKALEDLALRTGDQVALEVHRFLEVHLQLGKPHPQGIQILTKRSDTPNIVLVQMLEGDENLNDSWRQIQKSRSYAFFVTGDNVLILKASGRYTPIWKGLVMLITGRSAMLQLAWNVVPQDETGHFLAEKEGYNLLFRVLDTLGGNLYNDALENEVARLRRDIRNKGYNIATQHPRIGKISNPDFLNEIFGPPLSELEANARRYSYATHVIFRLIEEEYQGNVEQRKAAVLASIERESQVPNPPK